MFTRIRTLLGKVGELRRNAKLSRSELEAWKLEKFRRFVKHIQQRSPYYADVIRERSIDVERCVPADFPVLTKSILMANFDRIVTDRRVTKQGIADFLTRSHDPTERLFGEFQVLHTSGSSGEVGYFVYSPLDWMRGMAQGMRQRDSRLRPKRKRFGRYRGAFYGATGGHYAGVSMASSAKRGIASLIMDMRVYEVNLPLPQIIAQLNEFQPEFLSGYTTALKMLAEKQREGSLRIAPIMIGCAGETVTENDKLVLKQAFGCDVLNSYGSTEHLMMGGSVPGESAMTLYDDDLIYEIFDDHCLITNLFNETQPLIRYRMSDILRPISQPNPTSPYLVIDSLVGRMEHVPTFLNEDGVEDFISPHTINEVFVAGVARFQMHLVDKKSFRFLVCLDGALDAQGRETAIAGLQQRLREIFAQKKMSNVAFEVVVVEDLPVNQRTRKFQLIVPAAA